jgi:hypothetical protein
MALSHKGLTNPGNLGAFRLVPSLYILSSCKDIIKYLIPFICFAASIKWFSSAGCWGGAGVLEKDVELCAIYMKNKRV